MSTNNKISNIVKSQVPFFVKNDHPQFIAFLEAYYEFLEQNGQVVDSIKNTRNYYDIDTTIDQFAEKIYDTYLKLFPKNIRADRNLLLKHAKDFYLSRGTEKSIKFLMNIMFAEENVDFYYPKKDILRASDGKWYVQKSLKIEDVRIDNVSNTSFSALEKFVNTIITGNTSGATAIVERVDRFYESGTEVQELVLSDLRGTFRNNELIYGIFEENNSNRSIKANVFGGILNSVRITESGSGYSVGDPVIIQSGSGSGANVQVAKVSSGNIASIVVIEGGSGYQNNQYALISGGGGTGANAYISAVDPDETVHPNTYTIYYSTIEMEANTAIGNAKYSNLVSSVIDPANNWIANSLSSFVYGNTGPVKTVFVASRGSNYSSPPSISIVANTFVSDLGILSRMVINNGGVGYQIGDTINIENVLFGLGTGAAANVKNVAANGMITEVRWVPVTGHFTGGSGYSTEFLPVANVISANVNAYGANISVTEILGTGGSFFSSNTKIGAIERLIIYNKGSGYLEAPTLDLTGYGDGTAKANATIIQGVFTYPGRYLNDDGMLSTANYLQDRDYYQEFSYVLKLKSSIDNYRQALKDLVHPAGMKLFGEYRIEDTSISNTSNFEIYDSVEKGVKSKTYTKSGNTINIAYTSHGLSVNANVTLEFTSGGSKNVKNGIYRVTSVSANNFFVVQPRSGVANITILNSGALYNANSYIIFTEENGNKANAVYNVNAHGSIVSVTLTDYGAYYSSTPTATANGSNSVPATFNITLNHYANNTSGNVNVGILLV